MYGVLQKVELKFGFSGHLGDNHIDWTSNKDDQYHLYTPPI